MERRFGIVDVVLARLDILNGYSINVSSTIPVSYTLQPHTHKIMFRSRRRVYHFTLPDYRITDTGHFQIADDKAVNRRTILLIKDPAVRYLGHLHPPCRLSAWTL